jgi:pimeloyl-ACP methyl ester carboxylesterase
MQDLARTRASLPEPTDPAGEFVGAVHVVVEGDRNRPAVALVHGMPGSVRDYRYLAPALVDDGLCAVRIDMPGFGKTPIDAFASTRPADRAAFVRGVMRALGFAHFAVGGHSFGGGVAILCASNFRDDVRAIVCMNSIGPRRHRGSASPTIIARVTANALDAPIVGDKIHELLVALYGARGLRSDTGLAKEAVQHHAHLAGDFHHREMRSACRVVACPALVVSTSDDPLVEPASSFALARSFTSSPLASHLHVKSGGHFAQKHQARSIARWLSLQLA